MVEAELLHYGYLFILIGTVIEADATILTAAFLAHRGYFRLSFVFLTAALGTLISSQIFYAIGRSSGTKWLDEKRHTQIGKITGWSRNYSVLLVLGSRFMSGFRTLIPLVCGAVGMQPLRFAIWNFLGAILWALIFGFVGYFGGHAFTILFDDIRRHEVAIAIGLAVLVSGIVFWRTRGQELFDTWYAFRRLRS